VTYKYLVLSDVPLVLMMMWVLVMAALNDVIFALAVMMTSHVMLMLILIVIICVYCIIIIVLLYLGSKW